MKFKRILFLSLYWESNESKFLRRTKPSKRANSEVL